MMASQGITNSDLATILTRLEEKLNFLMDKLGAQEEQIKVFPLNSTEKLTDFDYILRKVTEENMRFQNFILAKKKENKKLNYVLSTIMTTDLAALVSGSLNQQRQICLKYCHVMAWLP